MPGPLPTGDAIRRNKPTIPTTTLPAAGRTTPVPDLPMTYELDIPGRDWWEWAWRTPQACAWDDGSLFAVARRAKLEDDMAYVARFDLAGGKLAIAREMRDLDDRLGLTPKGLAALRWKIVGDDEATAAPEPKGRRNLTAVPGAKTG